MRIVTRSQARTLLLLLTSFCVPILSHGQAWTPAKGEGDYSVVFQDLYTRDHLLQDGSRIYAGHVTLLGLVQSLDFGLTDKLAATVAFPLGAGKYRGPTPHQFPIDNGNYHGSLQDMGLTLRYNWLTRPLVLTPFVSSSSPMTHYEHFAHSAIGSDSWEFRMGVNAGHHFESILPRAYYQVQYAFVVAQSFMNIRPNKNRFNGEFGYFVTKRLSVRALALSQLTHGGLDANDFRHKVATDPLWRQHDRIQRMNLFNLGGGAAYSLRNNLDVFASLLHTMWGTNGHALYTGLTVGVTYSFRTPWARPQIAYEDQAESQTWRTQVKQPPQIQCAH
jgi:hypothetical protein